MHRPNNLTSQELAFLESLVSDVDDDPRIAALVLGGSHATGEADTYSDLDLYLITTNADFEDFLDERWGWLRSRGDAVFLEEHDRFGFRLLLFMYANGVRGEMAVAPERDIFTVHSGSFLTLSDESDILSDGKFEYASPDAAELRDQIEQLLKWFWYTRWYLDVALARDTLWTAHFYLDRCRLTCVNLARIRDQPNQWPNGYEKAEGIINPEWSDRIATSVVRFESKMMQVAATEITDCYFDLGREVATEYDVEFPEQLAETVSGQLTLS